MLTNQLLRKIDTRLLPFVALLYLASFLDRVNIGNAKIDGIESDLHLTEAEFNWSLSIFFIGHMMFELPSNIILKLWRPSRYIPLIIVIWGIITVLMSIITNAAGLLISRFFLGFTEAGLFPGILYYLPFWYTRHEMAVRIGIFFGASMAAGAFGGFLAFLITQLTGVLNLRGWQWLFIIEGGATILLGIVCWFYLPDCPAKAWFLTPEERELATQRLQHSEEMDDQGIVPDHIETKSPVWSTLLSVLKDWKLYLHCLIGLCGFPMYCLSLFLPSIIKELGYTSLTAQAMSAPPYIVGCAILLLVSWHSDYTRERGLHVAIPFFVAGIGFLLLAVLRDTISVEIRYGITVMTTASVATHIPPVLSWMSNNFEGHTRRAIAVGVIQSIANLGGVVAGQVYREGDKPLYVKGHLVCAVMCGLGALLCVIMKWGLIRENNFRRRKQVDGNKALLFQYMT